MSVTKIGPNLWMIKVSARVPGKPHPVKKQERFKGTKAEAEGRHAEIITHLRKCGSLICSVEIRTFKDAVDIYREKLQAVGSLSPDHARKIDRTCRDFGHLPLGTVADHLEAWRRNAMRQKLSPASLNRPVEIVKAVFNHLVALERVEKNPITKIRFPKHKEQKRDRYLMEEERVKLVSAITKHRPEMLPLIQYMLLVPCRTSELAKAERKQFCEVIENGETINVVWIPTSKNGKPMYKPVPQEMRRYFENLPKDCPWLFYWTDWRGAYRQWKTFKRTWKTCLKIAGLTDVQIRDLRHISATDLYSAGNPERMIMDIAGWATPMLSHYRHVNSLESARRIQFGKSINPNPGTPLTSATTG